MDTKLKRYKGNMLVRSFAFLVCVIFFVVSIVSTSLFIVKMEDSGRSIVIQELFKNVDYMDSADLQEHFAGVAGDVNLLISQYKSEKYIESGEYLNLNQGPLYEALDRLYEDGVLYYGNKEFKAKYVTGDREHFMESEETRINFAKLNKDAVDSISDIIKKDQMREYKNLLSNLERQKGVHYYATDGRYRIGNVNGNVKFFMEQPAYLIYEKGELIKVPSSESQTIRWIQSIDQSIENDFFSMYNDDLKVYIAFDESFIAEKEAAYSDLGNYKTLLIVMGIGFAGCVISFIYLAATTGRMKEIIRYEEENSEPDSANEGNGFGSYGEEESHIDVETSYGIYGIDKIWTEAQAFLWAAALGLGIFVCAMSLDSWMRFEYTSAQVTAIGAIYAVITILGLWFTLSLIRLIKCKAFVKLSLTYKLWNLVIHRWLGSLWNSLKSIHYGTPLKKRVVILAAAGCLLSATVVLAPFVFIFILYKAPKIVERFEAIKTGVEEVKNGNLAYKIELDGQGELKELADNINQISEASNKAIQNELKNQRLKTDLISNVSHDLKTPLTSMVSYVDLLKKEGLDSENAPEYLNVLDEKTNRLRALTEDLFEAAKASSGVMPVRLSKVELCSLINQGLGEMDEKIKDKGLQFIVNAQNDKHYVQADGQLLWRVVENLFGNVLKYALEGSRVYIDVKDIVHEKTTGKDMVVLEVKNISKNPLNISADELMERFTRGDESRTTEGSGLGLAIAKDLAKLQGGWLELVVDGDLFKARVLLNRHDETEGTQYQK